MFDVMSAGAAGGAKPDRMTVAELEAALPKAPGPSDVPAAWMQANRAGFQWDNSIERVVAREAGASLTVSGGDPLAINMENIALAGAFVEHLPSAPYPFDVDSEKAARGKLLFDAACQSCHQPRNPGVMGPAETGTDPNRVLAVTDFALTTLTTEVREGCKIPACYAKDGSALPDVDIWKMTGGYASLPLDGAWATAPYLHNGSVPTLKQLLTGDRPDKFYRGNTTYDQDIVGFTWDKATNPDAVVYDTSLAGFSNTGHTGAQFNGRINWASAPDKLADLLEYLKTL
jgi:hypothetical protein